jgi:membrane protease subunit HflC
MKRLPWLAVVGLVLVALLLAWHALVIVDETQYVLLTEFGRPVAIYGDEPGETGPHAKWPWQTAQAIDRRIQIRELVPREVITGDKRNLEIAPFVAWRVADPLTMLRAAGTPEAAAIRLEERVTSAWSQAIARRPLAALATTDHGQWQGDDLAAETAEQVRSGLRDELGLEILSLGLRRFQPPMEVRPAIFERIRSERRQVAETLRAEGEADYQVTVSQANREADSLVAAAEADAARIRADGEAEAMRTLNQAQARDPEFFAFLRSLETLEALLDRNTTLVLSASSPLLRLLREPPTSPAPPRDVAPSAAGESAAPDPATGSPSNRTVER